MTARLLIGLALLGMSVNASSVYGGVSGTARCEAGKIAAAGKKVAAKATCYKKALLKNVAVDPTCLSKADTKFTAAIVRADAFGACDGTAASLEADADACIGTVVGDVVVPTPTETPQPTVTPLATVTPVPTGSPTPCAPHSSGTYTDNCDGVVSDSATGLQWEQKVELYGIVDVGNLHDVDIQYVWAGCCDGNCSYIGFWCQPNAAAAATCFANSDGGTQGCSMCASGTCNVDPFHRGARTTVWDWVNELNAATFAGHSDWRLPAEGGNNSPATGTGAKELETILLAPYPCGTSPCIDPIFGPTSDNYWSATTWASYPVGAWTVDFGTGGVASIFKDDDFGGHGYVRAVRAGP